MAGITYDKGKTTTAARMKVFIAAVVGFLAGVAMTIFGKWQLAVLAAWDVAAMTYVVWTWLVIGKMNGAQTEKHALREDPSRGVADSIVLFAVVGSLVAVGFMLAESSSSKGTALLFEALFSIVSIAISWLTLHTLFVLHYAEQFYSEPKGGVDFGDTKHPSYHDFAYLAFTIGMTFQVSDTELSYKKMRRTALRHALISYVFGTIIVAATVNLVAGLGK